MSDPTPSAPPPVHFPDVRGVSLANVEHAFPRDFEAEWTLAVVTFRNDLDPLSDQWVLAAERIAVGTGGRLRALEFIVVGRRFGPLRGIVNATIARHAETDAERARTVPLYVDRDAFRKQLGLGDANAVHVLLVARGGRIAWRGGGALTPDQIAAIEAGVGETLSTSTPSLSDPASDAG